MSPDEKAEQDRAITEADPDIVWIGLGTPKQDFEAARLARATGRCCIGVGAAFDFAAGAKREAPAALRRFGLEWAFRLATEPGRLWRRYVLGNPRFLLLLFRAWRRGR
jgi:N-acetylglucosaminyldiphosphoundecaprenol N-acetyl-beta-D-mannosaminyltransferase